MSLCFLVCLGMATSLSAAVVLNWNGDYGTGPLQTGTVSQPDASTLVYRYSWTAAKTPVSGYTGLPVYGAFEAYQPGGEPELSRYSIGRSDGESRFTLGQHTKGGTSRGLVFFKKEDFYPDPDSALSFDASSSLRITFSAFSTPADRLGKAAVYARIGDQWAWYLSSGQITGTANLTITDLGSKLWGEWTLTEDSVLLPALPSSYTVAGGLFDEIGAFGFYYQSTSESGSYVLVNRLELDARITVIPEPGICYLLLAAGVSFVGLRKLTQKRRSATLLSRKIHFS